MSSTGAQLLMQALIDHGTHTIFGYPGGAIMPTYDALVDVGDQIRHVLARHEQGAIHAAQGFARVSGQVGVCLATSGPGATNFITGLVDAMMDSTPLVCITGQVKSDLLGTDGFQEADIIGLSLAATKWSYQIVDPAEVPAALRAAFRIARTGRPGPVLIDFTRDAQLATTDRVAAELPVVLFDSDVSPEDSPATVDQAGIDAAAQLINSALRPIVFAGQGVLLANATDRLRKFVETAGIPVASTLLGLSAFPAGHPLNVGMLGMHGSYAANKMTNAADVIVGIGLRFDDRVTGRLDDYAPNAQIIHVEIDPSEINRHVPAAVPLVGDAKTILARLIERIQPRQHSEWLARFRTLDREEYQVVGAPELTPVDPPIRMAEVIDALSKHTRGEAVIVSDVGQHQMIAARYYRFAQTRAHITSGGAGTMGFGLPAAIGAKLACPERQVIAIVGDGGFQMTLQELGTVAQECLALKIIVLNNRRLGMVRQWQELFFSRRYSFVDIESPDFIMLARAYGIDGRRVSERSKLGGALREMLSSTGPFLLEVDVAHAENVFPMIAAGASVDEVRLQ